MPDFIDRFEGASPFKAMKNPVRCATTADITLEGLQTIDGITVVADDRVLVKDQDDATENGIYLASTSEWTRTKDFDGNNDVVQGTLVLVSDGTTSTGQLYQVTTDNPITIDDDEIDFEAIAVSTANAILVGLGAMGTGTGMVAQTGNSSFAKRTLTGTANEITVTNGTGVSGNPTYSLPTAMTMTGKTLTGGIYNATEFNGPVGATTPAAGVFTEIDVSGSGGAAFAISGTGQFSVVTSGSGGSSGDIDFTTSGGGDITFESAVDMDFVADGALTFTGAGSFTIEGGSINMLSDDFIEIQGGDLTMTFTDDDFFLDCDEATISADTDATVDAPVTNIIGGNVVIGTAALLTTATTGFLWIPSCAGAAAGSPTSPYANAAALIVDTTNHRLYVRDGAAWRYTALST